MAGAILSGCGATVPTPGTIANTPASADSAKTGHNLLYVSNQGALDVYRFPRGKWLGTLNGASGPRGICADSAGDIFVPFIYIPGGIYEYAHGRGSPIADLGLEYDWPNGCSVSSKAGALAVVAGPHHGSAAVAVYHHSRKFGWAFAKGYSIPSLATSYFCGYDNGGNLSLTASIATRNLHLRSFQIGKDLYCYRCSGIDRRAGTGPVERTSRSATQTPRRRSFIKLTSAKPPW